MIRLLLSMLVLAACSCSTDPIAPDAQRQIDILKSSYSDAAMAVQFYDIMPMCDPAPRPHCYDEVVSQKMHQAHYDAGAALVVADGERTAAALSKARIAVASFIEQTAVQK